MRILIAAAIGAAVPFTPEVGAQSLDSDFEQLLTYESGGNSDVLGRITEAVNDSASNSSERRRVAEQLTGVLASRASSDAAKWFAAEQLRVIARLEDVVTLAPLLKRSDTSEMACFAIERIPGEAATSALVEAMRVTRGTTRVGIIEGLGNRGDHAAVQPLRRISGNGDPDVMRAAILAMGRIGGEDAAAATRWCSENIRYDLRTVATEAYLMCAEGFLEEGNLELAARMFDRIYVPSEKTELKVIALRGLLRAEPDMAPQVIIDTIQNEEDALREVAAESIATLTNEADFAAVADIIPSLSARQQALMLEALAERPLPAGRQATLTAARHTDAGVRNAAIAALSAYGDADTIETLIRLAASEDISVRDAARGSLKRMTAPGADDRIASAAMSADNVVRAEALRAIAARGATSALGIVRRAAERERGAMRVVAMEALGSIATVEDLPFLVRQFTQTQMADEREAARAAILRTAQRLEPGGSRVQPIAGAISGGRSLDNDIALINMLGEIGDDAALSALKAAAMKRTDELREAAIRTLGKWNSTAAVEVMDGVLKKTKSPVEEQLAIDGLLRLLQLNSERSAEETIATYDRISQRPLSPEQKKQLLAGLAGSRDARGAIIVQRYVNDPEVIDEARQALDRLRP